LEEEAQNCTWPPGEGKEVGGGVRRRMMARMILLKLRSPRNPLAPTWSWTLDRTFLIDERYVAAIENSFNKLMVYKLQYAFIHSLEIIENFE
jgi:hypothetical protein